MNKSFNITKFLFIKLYNNIRRIESNLKKMLDRKHMRATLATYLCRKLFRKPFIFSDNNGFKYIIFPEEHIYSLFYNGYLGFSEIAEQEFCKKVSRPGMTAFDVGANIGQFTLLLSSIAGSSGHVFAFEASKENFKRLKIHILLNNCTNIVAEQFAVYNEDDKLVKLNIFPLGYSAWNTLGKPNMLTRDYPKKKVEPIGSEDVQTITIDNYCRKNGINKIDYLKVDVEGAELDVLKGCQELLKRHAISYIQFEVSQAMLDGLNRDSKGIFMFLNSFGYICFPISAGGKLLDAITETKTFFANFIAMYEGEENAIKD